MRLENKLRISIFFIILLLLSFLSGCTNPPDAKYQLFDDIVYQEIPDVDKNLVSLDIYVPSFNQSFLEYILFHHENNKSALPRINEIKNSLLSSNDGKPVMIWVHGGGWRSGDKTNQLEYKIPYFINQNWIFVSVNYRLSPDQIPNDPKDLDLDRIKYPVHSQDVAAAVAWVHNNIEKYGGNPNQISLMGHSAGANIVSTVGTNETFLKEHGLNLSVLQHIISLDTAAYDIRERCETGAMLYLNAFGTNPSKWDDASPLNNIKINETLPSFFVVVQGTERRINQSIKFIEKVNQTGAKTQLVITSEYDHSEVNQAIGHPDDEIITPKLSRFLGFENNQTYFKKVFVQEGRKQKSSVLVDFNDDGLSDVVIASSSSLYFIQNHGDGTFSTVNTIKSQSSTGWGMHDIDRDGNMDLYLAQTDKFDWMINNGDGSFTSQNLGNEADGIVRTALFADFDKDALIDSYLSTSAFNEYHGWNQLHPGLPEGGFGDNIIDTILEPPIPDFFHKYADAPNGAEGEWSNKQFKGAVVRDFDKDGYPDIVACAYADRGYQDPRCTTWAQGWVDQQQRGIFFLQNIALPGKIQFEEIGLQVFGVDSHGNTSQHWNPYTAIPIDYDRDGDLDLFVGATLRRTGDGSWEDTISVRFYENECEPGNIQFIDKTDEVGFSWINDLQVGERAYRSFAAGAPVDVNNDGWVDLVLINRRDTDKTPFAYVHVYLNKGGESFQELDPDLHGLTDGGGGRDINFGDFNNDGRIDLVINDGTAGGYEGSDNSRIYINEIETDNHWIKLKVIDNETNSYAIGAKVSIFDSETDTLIGYNEVRSDFSYRSKRTPILHFGLGHINLVDIVIEKQNGEEYYVNSLNTDRLFEFYI